MSEDTREYLRWMLRYGLMLLGIALAVTAVILIAGIPRIKGSLFECVTREDNRYTLDQLTPGMSQEDVAATLDARGLRYAASIEPSLVNGRKTTWITLSESTRIAELGNVTVRRTYYFHNGKLAHVDLETGQMKAELPEMLVQVEELVDIIETEFGPYDASWQPKTFRSPGELLFSWYGEDDSGLDLIARASRREHVVDHSRGETPSYTDYLSLVIRVHV